MTPVDRQREAQRATGYGPIWLRRIGDFAVVEVLYGEVWVEVIREHVDGNFSHCVEPFGIQERLERVGEMMHEDCRPAAANDAESVVDDSAKGYRKPAGRIQFSRGER